MRRAALLLFVGMCLGAAQACDDEEHGCSCPVEMFMDRNYEISGAWSFTSEGDIAPDPIDVSGGVADLAGTSLTLFYGSGEAERQVTYELHYPDSQ